MRWLFRFSVYFVRPLLCWYIAGYFGYLSIKAIASSIVSYQRSVEKAERQTSKRPRLNESATEADTTALADNVLQCSTNGAAKVRRRSKKNTAD